MTEKSQNYFVRVGVTICVIYIASIIGLSFKFGPTPFAISSGIIVLIAMVMVLILAESFTDISLGSILRLKRDVAKAEEEKKEAKSELRELRTSFVTMASNLQQSQVTTNISGMDVAMLRRLLGVVEATPEDKAKEEEKEKEQEESAQQPQSPTSSSSPRTSEIDWDARRRLREKLETELINKFSAKYAIPLLDIRREVKFEAGLEFIDPIMNRTMIYDGYVKSDNKEYFLRIHTSSPNSIMLADRLYVALAKVLFYRQLKKVDAEMVLLYPIFPPSEEPRRDLTDRILQWFQPAISINLLRVEGFSFSEAELDAGKQ